MNLGIGPSPGPKGSTSTKHKLTRTHHISNIHMAS